MLNAEECGLFSPLSPSLYILCATPLTAFLPTLHRLCLTWNIVKKKKDLLTAEEIRDLKGGTENKTEHISEKTESTSEGCLNPPLLQMN